MAAVGQRPKSGAGGFGGKVCSINFEHLITTSVPRAMFTHFLVQHGLSQYYLC